MSLIPWQHKSHYSLSLSSRLTAEESMTSDDRNLSILLNETLAFFEIIILMIIIVILIIIKNNNNKYCQ